MILWKFCSGCRSWTACQIEFKLGIHVDYVIVNVLYQGQSHRITCQGQTYPTNTRILYHWYTHGKPVVNQWWEWDIKCPYSSHTEKVWLVCGQFAGFQNAVGKQKGNNSISHLFPTNFPHGFSHVGPTWDPNGTYSVGPASSQLPGTLATPFYENNSSFFGPNCIFLPQHCWSGLITNFLPHFVVWSCI